jgi:phosphatidylinositol alpha-1,6-mannosyltransferase
MKILLTTNDFPPKMGGIQTYCYEVAKNLASAGEQIIVLAPRTRGDLDFDKGENFKVVRIGSRIHLYFTFFSLLRREGIERIIVAHRANYARLASWANMLWKIPYSVVIYGGEILIAKSKRSIKENLYRAKEIITISDFTKKKLVEIGIPEQKIIIINPGVDPVRFHPGINPAGIKKKYNLENKRVILTISHLVERKGHRQVLRALPRVLEKIPELVYLIVGEGEEKERLRCMVEDLRLRDKVIFTGEVKEEELPLYYAACDLFIMPSYEIKAKEDIEGYGIAYVEAAALGKPTIGGRSGGVPDAVIDGRTGLLVDPLNVEEIAEALLRLLTNPELAAQLGKAGRRRVEEELNWEKIVVKLRRVICEKGA